MDSEFYHVALDRIRYSLVWEDSNTLYHGLAIKPQDRLLIISSAGCNVLNALLKKPRQVTAIDLNPAQNKLLSFKKHLILYHEHAVLRALMGLDGKEKVAEAWQQVEKALPGETKGFWSSFFRNHPEGLITSGRLETYVTGFIQTLEAGTQEKLRRLVNFADLADQRAFFRRELHPTAFRSQFIQYFDEANLSKGRDPKLFKYAAVAGGETFYERLLHHVSTHLVKDNFFTRFFFFGPEGLPEHLLPPCYRNENHATLREQLPHLRIRTGEAVDFLFSEEGADINKASLSNIFEYTSPAAFEEVCRSLSSGPGRDLRFIFWNLLHEQGASCETADWADRGLSDQLSHNEACFYFRNVRAMETAPVGVKQKAFCC